MRAEGEDLFLSNLVFDNRFTCNLPADSETHNFTRQVHRACYSRVIPKSVARPHTIAVASEVCELLDITVEQAANPAFAEVFSGNRLLPGMDPFAMCYGGHQFGNWAGQLGDGRAINLGEVVNGGGQRWMLQLKGAGPTPYSRSADGLAVMRSSVREFLCSEAMHHLGVPTTRALSIVGTGELVQRDMFYDGNPQMEPGAIVCRVAPSFTRFGNFQIFAARGDTENLKKLVEHTIRTDFPHLDFGPTLSDEVVAQWYREICQRTAEMVVHWMRVGFVHGVMNTDNMSILGLTIDYGPYGWLEDYDPLWTPNTTDSGGRRYRFGQQSDVAHWNLWQLANAIVPIVTETDAIQAALNDYADMYRNQWNGMMSAKLGLKEYLGDEDRKLIEDLLVVLQSTETDMTIFFRKLGQLQSSTDLTQDQNWLSLLGESYYPTTQPIEESREQMRRWLERYQARLKADGLDDAERRASMDRVNPKYVLRNYLAQLAIDKAEAGDFSGVIELLDLLRKPYDEQPELEHFASKRPEWARHRAGCSMLSCSS